MKKKLAALLILSAVLSSGTVVYADAKDDRIAELETQVEDLQATISDLESQIEELKAANPSSTNQDVYKIGDTWIVEGQWKLTVNSVEETAARNEFADTDPAAVYIITYTYENIGYEDEDGIMDGLFIDLSDGIVDAAGKMGHSYPGDTALYAQETPVGASCEAQSCIGVDNPGDFEIHFSTYDGTNNEQKAVFSLAVE